MDTPEMLSILPAVWFGSAGMGLMLRYSKWLVDWLCRLW